MKTKPHDQKKLRKCFIETLYHTLDGVISPTPYLEISEGGKVDIRLLNGKGRLPTPNSTEVTILDINLASLFFDDFHVLYEGVTGTGKTYTSDALFNAVFGPDGHYTIRLSGGVLGSSVLEPFTTTTLENGIPKTRIDQAKCSKYGGLFIDEINRGDSQEVLQVVDGKVHLNGDTGFLRVPIPGTDRYKSLAIIAAMNPADAQHSSSLELDLAGENRFLKFRFPNGAAEAGSGQLEKRMSDLYDHFWTAFAKKTGMEGRWRENYPIVTDPEQVSDALNSQTKEFIDISLGYVGADPKETYERNADIMKQAGVTPKFSIREDNNYKKILEIQSTLKHGFVRRDLSKIGDLSRLLGFIKGVKNGTYESDANLNDVVASIGVILESKSVTGTPYGNLMTLVNEARGAYSKMLQQQSIPEGYGIRETIWEAGLLAGNQHGFDGYIETLKKGIAELNTQNSPQTTHANITIKSRIISDLVVLDNFSRTYEGDVKSVLKEKEVDLISAFTELYEKKKTKCSIYEHRLDSIVR